LVWQRYYEQYISLIVGIHVVKGINISLKFNVKVFVENGAFTLLFSYDEGADILSLTVEREKSPPNPGCARERGLLLI
jgi:hypothetical protein